MGEGSDETRDEVIVPANTYIPSILAGLQRMGWPVLVETEIERLIKLMMNGLEAAITERTREF